MQLIKVVSLIIFLNQIHLPGSEGVYRGENSSAIEVPYFVHLLALNTYNLTHSRCGGSIIDKFWILTTASCLDVNSSLANRVDVLYGGDHISDIKLKRAVGHKIFFHKNYKNGKDDLALVRTDVALELDQWASTIELPKEMEETNFTIGLISGWGYYDSKSEMASRLITTELEIEKGCSYGTLCVIFMQTASCSGDSGGPLAAVNPQGKWTLLAVINHRGPDFECKDPGYPGPFYKTYLYTPVSVNLQWINETLTINNSTLTFT